MANVEKYANDLKELAACATEFKGKVGSACGGSFEWGVNEVVQSYLSIFNRFCPFKIGDRVQLKSTCRITGPEHGWYGSRHFLIAGSKAVVKERGYSDGQFSFYLEFDDESWKDDKGQLHPATQKHVYHFGENSIEAQQ